MSNGNPRGMLQQLESARRQGLLGDLDVHFARLIAEYGDSPPVLLAAALLSQLTSSGHVCLDLDALAEQQVLDGSIVAPPLSVWKDALAEHGACGGAAAYTPLVLDNKRLYMRRYFDYECAVAVAWQAQSHEALSASLQEQIAALFPAPSSGEDKQCDQRAAAIAALEQHRTLISGGPGTGKTTTLASILGLLLTQKTGLKILLAAPTGKAAARMQDAIRGAKARLPLSEEIKAAMPETAQTLHRLLGARPQGGGLVWRHDANNPLDCDVLVVDEASMIDLALMARLLAALPPQARLILLGDRDQLASVDAGAVFADLCTVGAATLNVSFRFGQASGIGQLAALVRQGDADAALALVRNPPADMRWTPEATRSAVVAHAAEQYAAFIEFAKTSSDLGTVFERFAAFRLLTPVRQGPLGVGNLNALIEQALISRGAVPPRSHWYVGKPIMVAANDYALRLFNGDIGICVADPANGELRICFPGDEGPRLLPPARLPPHETAWAMTVHKSQGSEFDHVALVLPDEQSEIVTRELVYTAVTRARQSVALWADEASFRAACTRKIVRHSGLVDRLMQSI
jgi:exodeoxyribonuclease V alpha subunit